MTDLTEQWRKGELPNGLYYIGNGKKTAQAQYKKEKNSFYTWDSDMPKTLNHDVKVLDSVPSYEEYRELKGE